MPLVSVTSSASGAMFPEVAASLVSRSVRRAAATTLAPWAASTSAKRRPRPDDAPVTRATSPVRSKSCCAGVIWLIGWTFPPSPGYLDGKSAFPQGSDMTYLPLVGLPADTYENHGFLYHSIGDKYVRAVAEVALCSPVMIP